MPEIEVWFFEKKDCIGSGLTDEGAEIMKRLGYKVYKQKISYCENPFTNRG